MRSNIEKVNTPALIKEVASRMGCYKKDARELLDHFTAVVAENVSAGRRVQYAGLGIFYPAVTRRGRGAGKNVRIRFRPAREFSEKVKTKKGVEGNGSNISD